MRARAHDPLERRTLQLTSLFWLGCCGWDVAGPRPSRIPRTRPSSSFTRSGTPTRSGRGDTLKSLSSRLVRSTLPCLFLSS